KGDQYTSALFYSNELEKRDIEESIKALNLGEKKSSQIVTKILPSKTFYPAEEYHQSYYQKNPVRYKYYRYRCGRDLRLKEIWGSSAGH
ncbi:peptide-methionine (S)-S-oxide reductase, partial [bacterium]|nr:peptide-methionine (S)-S-oxide reductase [bacterium]